MKPLRLVIIKDWFADSQFFIKLSKTVQRRSLWECWSGATCGKLCALRMDQRIRGVFRPRQLESEGSSGQGELEQSVQCEFEVGCASRGRCNDTNYLPGWLRMYLIQPRSILFISTKFVIS